MNEVGKFGYSGYESRLIDYGDMAGIRTHVMFALGELGLPVVHRTTVRALLPDLGLRGASSFTVAQQRKQTRRGSARRSQTSLKFGQALYDMEKDGQIERGQEFVRLSISPTAILQLAKQRLETGRSRLSFRFVDGLAELKAELAEAQTARQHAGWVEQRRLELLAIQAMMQRYPLDAPPCRRPKPRPGISTL